VGVEGGWWKRERRRVLSGSGRQPQSAREGVSWGGRFRVLLAPGSAGVRQVFFVALDKLEGGHPLRCLTRVTSRPARSSVHGSLASTCSPARVANPDPAPQPRGLAKSVRILTCSPHTAIYCTCFLPTVQGVVGCVFVIFAVALCRDWGEGPTPKSAYLGPDYGVCDDEDAGEMCQELMEIFQGSPRCAPAGPVYCGVGERDSMQPPSRNQNPLVKDQVLDVCLCVDLNSRCCCIEIV